VPGIDVPAILVVAADSASAPVAGVSVSGFDGAVTVTLSVDSGTPQATAQSTATVAGEGTDQLTVSGPEDEVNQTLATLTFSPAPGFTGEVTLDLDAVGGSGLLYFSGTDHYYDQCATMCYMGDAKVGVRELRQNLSVYLQRVKRGERLEVTERGKAIAVLQPLPEGASPLEALVNSGRASAPQGDLLELLPPKGGVSTRLTDALQEQRAERL
jgi:prevent-host-death family protein